MLGLIGVLAYVAFAFATIALLWAISKLNAETADSDGKRPLETNSRQH